MCGVVAGFVGECGEVVVPWWAATCAAPGRLWHMVPGLAEVSAVPVVRFRERACRCSGRAPCRRVLHPFWSGATPPIGC